MWSFNQRGAANSKFDISNDNVCEQQWINVQPNPSTVIMPGINQIPNFQPYVQERQHFYYNQSYNVQFDQFHTQPVSFAPQYSMMPQQVQLQQANVAANIHKARITLVPNSSGGFKAIVKRKRKRTMFTTEQIEVLESVFKQKPYVSREDRQVLVKQLQLTDTSVKVWFQNRRLRGKREEIEAAEEAMYEEENMQIQGCGQTFFISDYISHLNAIESKLMQKIDENGYIALDEKSVEDIASVINCVLSPDISLSIETANNDSENLAMSESVSETSNTIDSGNVTSSEVECCDDSESSAHDSVTVYEPVSPAESDRNNNNIPVWEPCNAELSNSSLQKLFDSHFC